jgi:hypothetical protein
MKKLKTSLKIDTKFTAEDWAGFQELMEKSNIQDKDVILRVLSMYTDPEERERQIKNLSVAYTKIADEILPELRRSQLKLTVDVIGKSDANYAVSSNDLQTELGRIALCSTLTMMQCKAASTKGTNFIQIAFAGSIIWECLLSTRKMDDALPVYKSQALDPILPRKL